MGTGRLETYKEAMGFWATSWKWVTLGVGPGTYMWYALISRHFVLAPNYFIQMHSDWLQILWELGAVGLSLSLLAFGKAIQNAWNNIPVLCGLMGSAAFAMTYHPLRFFPSALLVSTIFGLAAKRRGHGVA